MRGFLPLLLPYIQRKVYYNVKEKGYIRKDIQITEIAYGFVSLYDGLKINKLLGIDEDQNKNTWSRIVKTIFTGIDHI